MAGFAVVDVWRVKPGCEESIKPVLAEAHRTFSAQPGIDTIDYCLVDGQPDRYLVIFRYVDETAREEFVRTPELRSTMQSLSEFWELDDVFVKGPAADLV